MSTCPACRQYVFRDLPHTCRPLWEVERDVSSSLDGEPAWEETHEARGMDAEAAAEAWADREDCESADYWIIGGTDARVRVRPAGSSEPWSVFIVSGESVPTYSAREVLSREVLSREVLS